METKTCSGPCGLARLTTDFYKNKKNKKDGLSYICKACEYVRLSSPGAVLKRKERNAKNKERNNRYSLEWYSKNKESCSTKKREWVIANPERTKGVLKEWFKRNPSKNAAYHAIRRSRKLNASPPWIDFDVIFTVYKNCPKSAQVDHIIPLSSPHVCGLNVPWNLQYLTPKENLFKSNSFDGTYDNEGWRRKL